MHGVESGPRPNRAVRTGAISRRALLASAPAAALLAGPSKGQPSRRPDIVFIMADDLGFADLGCYGRREIRTPFIDGLARDGLRLTQAYANSAVCSASRTAIITGRYQDRIKVGLQEPIGDSTFGLPEGLPTLPLLFRAAGYHTALVGKWHLAGGEAGPHMAGYEYFYGFLPGASDYFRRPAKEEAEREGALSPALYEDGRVIGTPGYLTDLLAAAAVRQIEQTPAGQPLLLSLHFNAPHWPWEGPDDEGVSRSLKHLRDDDGGNEAVYGRMIERMDWAVGQVLAALKRSGRAANAIVLFTSDNGGERFADTWPLIGRKGELLEGGIRVPLLVRWPGRVPAGRASEQVMVGMDWLPTLAAAAGLAPSAEYPPDGENLLPVLCGQAPPHPRKLFWRFKASEQAAVREGDWKYLKLGGKEHLFNLAEDAREQADRKALEPALTRRLRSDYDSWNATMLPYPLNSVSESLKAHYADRY
jgi:arylsulfatase A-like enzyme